MARVSGPADAVGLPHLAGGADGAFAVSWTGWHGGRVQKWVRRYDAEGRPAPRLRLDSHRGPSASDVVLAFDPETGGYLAVWGRADDSGGEEIRGRFIPLAGTPAGPAFLLAGGLQGVAATVLPGEGLLLTGMTSRGELFAGRFDRQGAALAQPVLHRRRHPIDEPSAAPTPDGGFLATFTRFEPIDKYRSNEDVLVQRFASDGAPLGDAFGVATDPQTQEFGARLVRTPAGPSVAVWQRFTHRYDTSRDGVFLRLLRDSGKPKGAIRRVSTGEEYGATAAVDPKGRIVVVWMRYTAPLTWEIRGRRFDSRGRRDGERFLVGEAGHVDTWPSVTFTGENEFLVAWRRQGRERAHIIGRRFAMRD